MIKELWVNLPVKNIETTRNFFLKLGFEFPDGPGNTDVSASMKIGSKNVIIMFFAEELFSGFIGGKSSGHGTEVLLSFDVESREEVDRFAEIAGNSGGRVFGRPSEIQGWMYGCGFEDPDGHRWNVLYMDQDKMQGQK